MAFIARNSDVVQPFWGRGTQPDRIKAVLQYAAPQSQILDLGCGQGAYSRTLNQRGFCTIGLDIHHYSEWTSGLPGAFAVATGTALPFAEKQFDLAIAFEVLEHIPNPERVLREVSRCTKKFFIFSVPNCDLSNNLRRYDLAFAHWSDPSHCNFFTKDSLQNFVAENGFKIVQMVDCYRISPNNYYWDTLKIPRYVSRFFKKAVEKLHLAETYWSSILVVAEVP